MVLKYIQTFFDNSPLRRWNLILLPLSAGQKHHLLSNQENAVEVMVCSMWLSPCSFSWTVTPGKARHHVVKTFKQPMETLVWRRLYEELRPPTDDLHMWSKLLGSKSFSASKAFRWLQPRPKSELHTPREPFSKAVANSWSAQTVWEIHLDPCFKPPKLGFNCYAAIGTVTW